MEYKSPVSNLSQIQNNLLQFSIEQFVELQNLSSSSVLFLETHYNKEINNYITNNYTHITKQYRNCDLDFIYLPLYNLQNILSYANPQIEYVSHISSFLISTIITEHIFKCYIKSLPNAFLLIIKDNIINISPINPQRYEVFFTAHSLFFRRQQHSRPPLFCKQFLFGPIDDDDEKHQQTYADNQFENNIEYIVSEIDKHITYLKDHGLWMIISNVVMPMLEQKPPLSRLQITTDYKIFLPDYKNIEIKLHPLAKAVFFLFLKYPQGIMLKELPDYHDELRTIYLHISPRENIEKINLSISKITDPTENSINEKCSMIKKTFLEHFTDDLAKNYYITGTRGTPKRITLNRNLILGMEFI